MTTLYQTSIMTGKRNGMSLNTDKEKLEKWLASDRQTRGFVQDVFPELNAVEREFLVTGMSQREQESIYG